MSDIVAIFDDASAFFTEAQWKAAMSFEKGFSDNYEFLSTWALEEGRALFNKVIKHHLHLFQDAMPRPVSHAR